MLKQARTGLVWLLCLVALITTGLALLLLAATWWLPTPINWGFRGVAAIFAVVYTAIGALIASRRPANLIGWIYLAAGAYSGVQLLVDEYATYGLIAHPGSLPGATLMAWVTIWNWVLVLGTICTYPFLLFPNGHLPSARWRPVAWLAALGMTLMTLGFMASPIPSSPSSRVTESLVTLDEAVVGVLLGAGSSALGLSALLSVAALLLRFRHATGAERQQLKWLTSAGSVLAFSLVIQLVVAIAIEPRLGYLIPFDDYLLIAAVVSLPGAAAIAILRYRLYDVDLIINRALVYAILTTTLVALYLGSVVLLQGLFRALLGQSSELAIIISTLGIAALFQPLRGRIQRFIDRRFYRQKYDAARTLVVFSRHLRDEVDLPMLQHELLAVVRETMQPAHVSLWVRPAHRVSPTPSKDG